MQNKETTVQKLAAFDVDGTLTFTDSFMLFLRYKTSALVFALKLVSLTPVFIAYFFKLISRDITKEYILSSFLKGMKQADYQERCNNFAKIYDNIIRNDGIEAIKYHQSQGHIVTLVSASLEDYLIPFAKKHSIENVIATRLEIKNGILTGKMLGSNCRAQEKLNRIHEKFGDIEIIAAYGDSRGDKEMIDAATNKFYRTLNDAPPDYKKIKRALYFSKILD